MTANSNSKEVLLVDDDTDYSELTRTRLEAAGYQVAYVSNGCEALKLLDGQWRPNLIILDVDMPNSNGLTTLINLRARQVRQGSQEPPVPVVIATGLQSEQVHGIMAAQSISGYLRKPYSSEELLGTVKGLIG